MRVFQPAPTDASELCHPIDGRDSMKLNELMNGRPRSSKWIPIDVELIRRDDDGIRLAPSDCPWFGPHALIFKMAAVLATGDLLRQYGELLPLKCVDGPLHVYNPTVVVNALDENGSIIDRLPTGRIARITKYAFEVGAIGRTEIFKITTLFASPTFVTERFVERWRAAGLNGLEFDEVWRSTN